MLEIGEDDAYTVDDQLPPQETVQPCQEYTIFSVMWSASMTWNWVRRNTFRWWLHNCIYLTKTRCSKLKRNEMSRNINLALIDTFWLQNKKTLQPFFQWSIEGDLCEFRLAKFLHWGTIATQSQSQHPFNCLPTLSAQMLSRKWEIRYKFIGKSHLMKIQAYIFVRKPN